jgi:cytochrome c556
MRGISKPHCQGLETLLKDAGPADDKAWETAQCHASCVNEVSFLLMDDGRCPDKTWADAAKSLRAGAQSTLEAAEKKDLEGARKGFQMVKDACAACHKAHKKSQ